MTELMTLLAACQQSQWPLTVTIMACFAFIGFVVWIAGRG